MAYLQPVIHVEDEGQARAQAEIARECGADGIWLIGHSMAAAELMKIFPAVRKDHPNFWIGVNFLDVPAIEAMWFCGRSEHRIDGLWTDRSGVDDKKVSPVAKRIWEVKGILKWDGLYFGGVAFKYQKEVHDWAAAAKNAASVMDVVTTSGPGTGQAASIDKIRAMSTEVPKLAIASGITPENVKDYLGLATHFMVATGISKSFSELDPERTKRLADIIHAGVQP